MRCENCGAELPEDSVFCENCGHKAVKDVIYCPDCGKKCSSEDAYCEHCGARLSEPEPEERLLPAVTAAGREEKKPEEKPAADLGGRILFALASVMALIIAVGLFSLLTTGRKEKSDTQLLYYQDETLYLSDAAAPEKTPLEISDSLAGEEAGELYGLMEEEQVGRTGTYLFYREDFNGETYDLYCRKLSGDEAAVKIDSNISRYQVLKDDTVLYVKRDSLYYFDGHDSVRFGRRIDPEGFLVDKDEKYLFWAEDNGEDGYVYYYQDLAGKNERTELDEDAREIFPNEELTSFIELKYDNLYQMDNKGNKKRIAGNVAELVSCDPETGRLYYLSDSPIKASYEEIIYEDVSMSEEDRAGLHEMGRFELPYQALHYYDGAQDYVVTERFFPGDPEGFYDSGKGRYCLYMEGPKPEDIRVNWSQFRDSLEAEDFGVRVLEQAAEDGLFSDVKLAAGSETAAELENVDNAVWFESAYYCGDTDRLYLIVTNYETEEGILYETGLSGNDAGSMKELDSDAFELGRYVLAEEGIYYIKGSRPEGGDLYLNGEVIDYDVYWMRQMEGGALIYLADCEIDADTGGIYATLMEMTGDEKRMILDDVSFGEVARDGTAVLLADYDFGRREGELIYCDGDEKRVIAEDAAGFAPRQDSLRLGSQADS